MNEASTEAGRQAFDTLLRSQRVWDVDLPGFDPESAPAEPTGLFHAWFADACAAGQPEPHTMQLATVDADGLPDVRTLMLHGAADGAWHFASHSGSRKGRQLAARPRAALHFYWAALGRQVRVRGTVTAAPPAEASADLHARSIGALAAALVGRQSEPLDSLAELAAASTAAWERAGREPDAEAPTWTLYELAADEVEFFQGDARRRHVRLRYERQGDRWVTGLLWP
ncbi:pyridoxine/pyridoxamine 5'-phosphate oxidase [Streptomyces cavernicola]|uniref:Pyridoxal 5'-phosphate synthase n=1 Tax=Streptomyces cavernicola TaxID=3043613 RepID=A0ABT6SIB8_9ACTN|nr:pyridoxal 5'-phosphate synthase [Streptomyces sp. B-S-A6]MDI3407920.1 pyridoxal 5'-phosphate synthase [Streptomyces sp. B-S-A6]